MRKPIVAESVFLGWNLNNIFYLLFISILQISANIAFHKPELSDFSINQKDIIEVDTPNGLRFHSIERCRPFPVFR